MNYKENIDGVIEATFTPKDLPILVKLVRATVDFRARQLRKEAKGEIAAVVKAEKELEKDYPTIPSNSISV